MATKMTFNSRRYPTDPGCYLMHDTRGRVIYVGKAKNLRQRLASYFQKTRHHRKTWRLIAQVAGIEVILVNNETESLVLENNLIKHHRPRFNRRLMRYDIGYPYIMLTGERFPRLLPYRRYWHNKQFEESKSRNVAAAERFGPFLGKPFRDLLLNFAIEHFRLRICHRMPRKVCFRYELGKCSGICEKKISMADYAEAAKQAAALLSARQTTLLRQLEQQMWNYAEQLEFERAQKLRDLIRILTAALERQIVERDVDHDEDVLYAGDTHILVMQLKLGMLYRLQLFPRDGLGEAADSCSRFLLKHYSRQCPPELTLNQLGNPDEIARQLAAKHRHPVRITLPEDGIKADLLRLCEKNYSYRVERKE